MRRPQGLNVVGYFRAESGVGELSRLTIKMLRAAGVPYSIFSNKRTPSRQTVDHHIKGSHRVFDCNLICVNADQIPSLVRLLGRSLLRHRYTIGYWAWEVEVFPKAMAEADKFVDEIWTLSDHAASAIRAVVNKPVYSFPLPIVSPPLPLVTRTDMDLPSGYLFLFCFDFYSGFDRKNPLAIIEAFCQTFPVPGEALLVIKSINGRHFPDKLQSLLQAVSSRPDILLRDGSLASDQQAALMMICDCYVSLHRAEGFGLTIAEAMAMGKPVIATAYSGNLEYMTVDNSYLVPFTLQPIGPECDPYPEEALWAAPNIKIAAEMMRFAFEHPEAARLRGRRAARDVAEYHSLDARARLLLSLLASSGHDGDADRPGALRSVVDGLLARSALRSLASVMILKRYLRRLFGPSRHNRTVTNVQGGA